jgi:single-strand selective monofunctional uracil DNA glycosylase
MMVPVRCFTCGTVVGEHWEEFKARTQEVEEPEDEHPKRPVDGLDCGRNEVSGSRLWGWAEERFGSADSFFERFYVHNYCPLLFLDESGRNRPPSRMKVAQRDKITPACDEALREIIAHFEPNFVIGVGNAATRLATGVASCTFASACCRATTAR